MSDPIEQLAVATVSRVSRRSFLGRAAGLVTAIVAGTAMPVVLPASRASAGPGRNCPPAFCTCGKRVVPETCWFECGGRCCGRRVTRICDCCRGRGCKPNHFCSNPGCILCAESFHECTPARC